MRVLLTDERGEGNPFLKGVLEDAGFRIDEGSWASWLPVTRVSLSSTLSAAMAAPGGHMGQCDLIVLFSGEAEGSARALQALTALRGRRQWKPLIVVGRDWDILGGVRFLKAGADDVVAYASAGDELVARIHAVLRRSVRRSERPLKLGDLALQPQRRTATLNGAAIPLSRMEYRILEVFLTYPETLLSKRTILRHMYNDAKNTDSRIVDVYVCKLRKKLAQGKNDERRHVIRTVWGEGYMLCAASPG